MARALLALALICGIAACGGGRSGLQHPLTNELEPEYESLNLKTLGALPFASDISEDEDPDGVAAGLLSSKFYAELNQNTGFTILTETEVARVIDQAGKTERLEGFYKDWINDQWNVDEDLIKEIAAQLNVDAIVAGAVDVWYQDEVDITEEGAARTAVGVLIGLFDGKTGKRLWLGRDENYKDGLRYPGASELSAGDVQRNVERSNQRTVGGAYAPPDYSVVVQLVVDALVEAFPAAAP